MRMANQLLPFLSTGCVTGLLAVFSACANDEQVSYRTSEVGSVDSRVIIPPTSGDILAGESPDGDNLYPQSSNGATVEGPPIDPTPTPTPKDNLDPTPTPTPEDNPDPTPTPTPDRNPNPDSQITGLGFGVGRSGTTITWTYEGPTNTFLVIKRRSQPVGDFVPDFPVEENVRQISWNGPSETDIIVYQVANPSKNGSVFKYQDYNISFGDSNVFDFYFKILPVLETGFGPPAIGVTIPVSVKSDSWSLQGGCVDLGAVNEHLYCFANGEIKAFRRSDFQYVGSRTVGSYTSTAIEFIADRAMVQLHGLGVTAHYAYSGNSFHLIAVDGTAVASQRMTASLLHHADFLLLGNTSKFIVTHERKQIFEISPKDGGAFYRYGFFGDIFFVLDPIEIGKSYNLRLVDLSDRTNPVELDGIVIDRAGGVFARKGNYLLAGGGPIIDLTDPQKPKALGRFEQYDWNSWIVDGDQFIASSSLGNDLTEWSLQDINQPRIVKEAKAYPYVSSAFNMNSGFMLLADRDKVHYWQPGTENFVPRPDLPGGKYQRDGTSENFWCFGNYEATLYDLSVPESPAIVTKFDNSRYRFENISVDGNRAISFHRQSGQEASLRSYDVSDLSNPRHRPHEATITGNYEVNLAGVRGAYAYVTRKNSELIAFEHDDLSKPPVVVLTLNEFELRDALVLGNYVYVGFGRKLRVYRLKGIQAPELVYEQELGTTNLNGMRIDGNVLYVANSGDPYGHHLFDVSDPANPKKYSNRVESGWTATMIRHGNFDYLLNNSYVRFPIN